MEKDSPSRPGLEGDALPEKPMVPVPHSDAEPEKPDDSSKGMVGRIASHTENLAKELSEWVDLKIKLARLEIEASVEQKVDYVSQRVISDVQTHPKVMGLSNAVMNGAIAGILALAGFILVLAAASIILGGWLGHYGWGLFIVGGATIILAGLIWKIQPRFVRPAKSAKPTPPAPEKTALPPASATE